MDFMHYLGRKSIKRRRTYTTDPMEIFELKGKTAVVTGAARGIGKATADLLEKAGATVARIDIDSVPGVISADVADEAAVEKAFKKIGAIDILVNNAGIAVRKTSLEISREEWDRVIAVNLTGLFLCSRVAAHAMKQNGKDGSPRGGAIVNLASIMGFSGGIFPNPAYQASKGAVVNLTRALALEFAEYRIRVNAVAPTFVRTDLTTPVFGNPDVLKKVMHHTPLGVLPEVDDIAAAILFLAGPAARCITGVTLPVDSGYLAR
jgi:NAD(P)-dependent dehydrogenase (short-subunit alcohol dehydrogenase family)